MGAAGWGGMAEEIANVGRKGAIPAMHDLDAFNQKVREAQAAAKGFDVVVVDVTNTLKTGVPASAGAASEAVERLTGTMSLGLTSLEELNRELTTFYDRLAQSQFGIPGSSVGTPMIAPSGYRPIVPRQAGGPVSAGGSYVVGERGPELFMPSTSGAVMPSRWGGVSVQNTFHIVDNTENIARRVADEIMREILSGRRFAGA